MANPVATFLFALARRSGGSGVIINEHTLTRAQTGFHVQVLSRWFEFIKLEDLPHWVPQRSRKPFCVLTFDDGKRSNFTETAPELESRQVPAVFYVTTDPLSGGAGFWFDRRNQLVKQLGRCPAGLELPALKKLPFNLLTERLERACAQHGFAPDNASDDMRPMSWDEARDLARRGFTIGAHGLTHAILTNETKARAFAEIEGSLAKVSAELGAPCTTFAFPNGNYTQELARHALHHGATTVMTTEPAWVHQHSPSWRLPRIQLFGGFNRAKIELKTALATWPGILANPNGSGRGYRTSSRRNLPGLQEQPALDRLAGKAH